MDTKQIPYRFEFQLNETDFSPTSDPTLRFGKARVFYKYLNRNGSYITDEFADKLANSAYFKPIVGTYDITEHDFKSHESHEEAKSYGFVVPGSLKWEQHADEDGIIRNYATYDIVIWAKYWEEAKQIFEKKQSMEIDPDTIVGEWTTILLEDREEYAYVYTDGIMGGLCVLGNSHPPCFEGAAFFSLEDDSYKEFSLSIQKFFKDGGKNAMENTNQETVVETPVVEEEVAPVVEEQPVEEPTNKEESNAEEPSVAAEPEVDYEALYNKVRADYDALSNELNSTKENYEALVKNVQALQDSIAEYKNQNDTLQNDINAQHAIIEKYENEEKDRIIGKFTGRLPADIVSAIEENKANMTIDEINNRFALEYTSFSMAREQDEEVRVPNVPQEETSALARILNKYKK